MKKLFVVLVFAASHSFGGTVVINFDEQPQLGVTGVVITNQYAGVLFSSTAGFVNYVSTQPAYNSTKPNFLCTGPLGSGINCTAETILDFANPVSGLRFDAVGIHDTGLVAKVDVFTGGVFNSTVNIFGASQALNPVLVDLTAFSNLTKIRIHDITDGGGIGWDTFRYETALAPAPEPSSVLLLACGGLVAMMIRRSRSREFNDK